jgi:chemotaxis protein methyltransferase WspC
MGTRFEDLLGERLGLDPASLGEGAVQQVVSDRMHVLQVEDDSTYLDLVRESDDELDEIIDQVLVPETWFFREPAAFALVRARAHAARERGRLPLRVLSLPCATGEEAYSLAITLLHAGLSQDEFHIDAVDVSRRALAAARAAVFGSRSLRQVGAATKRRYFELAEGGCRLRHEVAQAVVFTRGNLVDPHLLAGANPYDIVFCRNVLIYLSATARARAVQTMNRLVADDGILVTGHAEGLRLVAPTFGSAGHRGVFAYRKTPVLGVQASGPATGRRLGGARPSAPRPPGRAVTPGALVREFTPLRFPRVTEAAPLVQQALRLADSGRLDEARVKCREAILERPDSAHPHFLLGIIELGTGRHEAAEQAFRRAVSLDPYHEDALLHLAFACARRGEAHEAERLRRRAALARAR